jgi:5-methylcytosine-specific restriction enzyme A
VLALLRSCSYCGSIHDSKYVCPKKPVRKKDKPTYIDKFRWSKAWQKKRKQINERDNYLCQVCIRELYNTIRKYTYQNIEVHHIYPLAETEGWTNRLNDEALICLCKMHHEMGENGQIPRKELLEIVREQEDKVQGL